MIRICKSEVVKIQLIEFTVYTKVCDACISAFMSRTARSAERLAQLIAHCSVLQKLWRLDRQRVIALMQGPDGIAQQILSFIWPPLFRDEHGCRFVPFMY